MTTPQPASPAAVTECPGGWTRAVLRLGRRRSLALITGGATLLALASTWGLCQLFTAGNPVAALAAVAIVMLMLTPLLAAPLLRGLFDLEQARREFGARVAHDELTGLSTRQQFIVAAQREWERARRYGNDAALLLIDADYFGRLNAEHGRACGDELLRRMAQATAASLRQPDVLARYGGAALIVFLPQTDPLGALDAAERIRTRVQDLRLPWQGLEIGATVSIGVAPLRAELPSFDWMVHEAETALMAAKADGRNCVRTLPFQPNRSGEAYPVNSR